MSEDVSRTTDPTPSEGAPKADGAPRGIGPPWLRGLLATPFALVVQVLAFAVIVLAFLPLFSDAGLQEMDHREQMLLTAATCLFVVPALWLAWLAFARASLADMGHAGPWRRAVGEGLAGFFGGVLLLSIVLALGAAGGAYEIEPGRWTEGLAAQGIFLPALLLAAYFEELLLRGWVLQDLGRRSVLLGLGLSSLVFAFLHGYNDNIGANGNLGVLVGLANIFLAGLLLGGLFLLTGRLWLPTGLHLGWNWAMAVLFGLPVSGYRLPSLLATEATEDSGLLSGGAFGPEGSVLALLVLGPAALGVVGLALKRRCAVPIVARHAPGREEGAIILESGPQTDETA